MRRAGNSGRGAGATMPSPSTPLSQYLDVFTNLEVLQTPSAKVFMGASLGDCD